LLLLVFFSFGGMLLLLSFFKKFRRMSRTSTLSWTLHLCKVNSRTLCKQWKWVLLYDTIRNRLALRYFNTAMIVWNWYDDIPWGKPQQGNDQILWKLTSLRLFINRYWVSDKYLTCYHNISILLKYNIKMHMSVCSLYHLWGVSMPKSLFLDKCPCPTLWKQ
jgi:hypothetical protein